MTLRRRPLPCLLAAVAFLLALWEADDARAQQPTTDDLRVLWSDGDALLLGAGRRSLQVIDDEGRATAVDGEIDIDAFVDADGTRALGSAQAVFAAADGRLVRWSRGQIEHDRVPLVEGDELVAVLVDASGTIYALGRERALYRHGKRGWRVFPYPGAAPVRPLAGATSPGGEVFVVGRDGLLIRFSRDGTWDRPLVPGLSPAIARAPWHRAWYSAVTKTLWVRAGRDRLLELKIGEQRVADEGDQDGQDGQDGQATADGEGEGEGEGEVEGPARPPLPTSGIIPTHEHPIPIGPPDDGEPPSGFTAITGVSAASGDRVLSTAGGRLWLYERERFVELADDVGLVHDIALDEGRDRAWITSQAGLRVYQLRAVGESAPDDQPLEESDLRLLDRLLRRQSRERRAAGLPKLFWMPTVRVDNGVVFPLGAEPRAGYSLELGAGAMLAPFEADRGPSLWLWPEIAYRVETHPTRGGHLFDIGLGFGFGTHVVAAYYRPRVVVGGLGQGRDDDDRERGQATVYGLRHGVALEALWGVIGLEFSHQYLGSNQGGQTDLRLGLSVNLAPIVWGGILWATTPTGR